MKHLGLSACSALALACVVWPGTAFAQQGPNEPIQAAAAPSQTSLPPGPRWEVNWSDNYCMLIRGAGSSGSKSFGLRRIPGSDSSTDLITVDPTPPQSQAPPERDVTISLAPSGRPLSASMTRAVRRPDGTMVLEIRGGRELLDHFATSSGIEVRAEAVRYFQMDFPSPQTALRVLRQCEDDALRGWGIDPAALRALQRPPEVVTGGVTSADYPASAIEARQEGVVLIRLTIDPRGRVEECAVVAGSGSAALDQQSCAATQRRARFRPALGSDGQPTRSIYVLRVAWTLPR